MLSLINILIDPSVHIICIQLLCSLSIILQIHDQCATFLNTSCCTGIDLCISYIDQVSYHVLIPSVVRTHKPCTIAKFRCSDFVLLPSRITRKHHIIYIHQNMDFVNSLYLFSRFLFLFFSLFTAPSYPAGSPPHVAGYGPRRPSCWKKGRDTRSPPPA